MLEALKFQVNQVKKKLEFAKQVLYLLETLCIGIRIWKQRARCRQRQANPFSCNQGTNETGGKGQTNSEETPWRRIVPF